MHKPFLVLLAFAVWSCEDGGVSPSDQIPGQVVFEIEYVNFAWGYAYEGKAVSEDRNLYSYNPGAEGVDVLNHPDEQYTASDLTSKYRRRKAVVRAVSADTLIYMKQLVTAVRIDDNSDTTSVGADMGAVVYSAYRFRADVSKYQRVILQVEGDWTFHNRSEAAVALVDLMKRL